MEKVISVALLVVCSMVQGHPLDCDGAPGSISPGDCCQLPRFFPNDLLQRCSQNHTRIEYQPPQKAPRAPPLPAPLLKSIPAIIPRGGCIFECAFNATEINLEPGGMDMTDISKYFTDTVQYNAAWNDTLVDALEHCVRDTHSKLPGFRAIANMPPTQSGRKFCNPMAGYLMGCLHSYLFQKCPESLWTNSQECRDVMAYQERCPMPFAVRKS